MCEEKKTDTTEATSDAAKQEIEQAPVLESKPQAEEKPLSDQKRSALLRYMAVLFAVAFLLVLVSLLIQTHSSKAAISEMSKNNSDALSNAMANAEILQDQNRQLQEDNKALRAQIDELEAQANASTEDDDQALEAELDELKSQLYSAQRDTAHAQEAYDALITAFQCETHEGNLTFSKAMDTVEKYKEYLSSDALAVYEQLLGE